MTGTRSTTPKDLSLFFHNPLLVMAFIDVSESRQDTSEILRHTELYGVLSDVTHDGVRTGKWHVGNLTHPVTAVLFHVVGTTGLLT